MSNGAAPASENVPPPPQHEVPQAVPDAAALPGRSLPPITPQEVIRNYGHEFSIHNIQYRYQGPAHRGHVFASLADGVHRTFLMYQSHSGGGLRISQGLGTHLKERHLKGDDSDPRSQYTQDTQLHPEFAREALALVAGDYPTDPAKMQVFDALYDKLSAQLRLDYFTATRLEHDFGRQLARVRLGSEVLDHQLAELRSGAYKVKNMRELNMPGADQATVWGAYQQKIAATNETLLREGVIPDFTVYPLFCAAYMHPRLGPCMTEVFTHKRDNTTYEWHMSRDLHGRAWVDRIRLSGSEPTAYGTDAQVVSSGILTSKPIDYTKQLTGIPEAMRPELTPAYSDMTAFLDLLAPVAQYKRQYAGRRPLFEDRYL